MTTKMRSPVLAYTLLLVMAGSAAAQTADSTSYETQIEWALLPLPEDMRDGAKVMGYTSEHELIVLREGDSGIICVADEPGDDRYSGVCYHKSLDPFIARGRQLRAEGVPEDEVLPRRHEEMDAGTLQIPDDGAALYNITVKLEDFDPKTASAVLYAIYTPYATAASTGLPESPPGPGAPWIMRSGTPSSHIMIVVPKPQPEKKEY